MSDDRSTDGMPMNGHPPNPSPSGPTQASSLEPLLQFFAFTHLPDHLQAVSRPFCILADEIARNLPRNPERTTALRKLLEAKDCAVRALLYR